MRLVRECRHTDQDGQRQSNEKRLHIRPPSSGVKHRWLGTLCKPLGRTEMISPRNAATRPHPCRSYIGAARSARYVL